MEGIWGRVQAEVEENEGRRGMRPFDMLDLTHRERSLMKKMIKKRVISMSEAEVELEESEAQAAQMLAPLVEKTYLIEFEKKGKPHYKLLMARKRGRELPFNIWDNLTEKTSA